MRHSGKRKWPIVEREVERVWRMRVVVDLRGGWLGGFSVRSLLGEGSREEEEEEDMVGGFGGVASWTRRRWWMGWKVACSWIEMEKVFLCVAADFLARFVVAKVMPLLFFPFPPESSPSDLKIASSDCRARMP